MRKLLLVLAMAAIPMAMAQSVTFYTSQATFNAALAAGGFSQTGGIENYAENAIPPGTIPAIDDPLQFNVPSSPAPPSFPTGLREHLKMQANVLAGNPTTPSPHGAQGLAGLPANNGFTTFPLVVANFFVDSYDLMPMTPVPAMGMLSVSILGSSTNQVHVYDAANNLIGTTSVSSPTAGGFLGIIASAGTTIGRINLFDSGNGAEGATNIAQYVPEPASILLLAAALVLRRR